MMINIACNRCAGTGIDSYNEYDHIVYDTCYHCSGSGTIDEETSFHDRLRDVAAALAYQKVSDYKKARNSGDDGFEEDFGFCAAENMMTENDYFCSLVWDTEAMVMNKILEMSKEDQELLVAWNEMESELVPFSKPKVICLTDYRNSNVFDDEIPF